MWVIDLENPPPRLRGMLSRWGVEVRAGMYVGTSSGKQRDALWTLVTEVCEADTSAVMVFDARGPQGFGVRTHGPNRREIVDVDGLHLARFVPRLPESAEPPAEELTEEARAFDPAAWDVDAGYLEP